MYGLAKHGCAGCWCFQGSSTTQQQQQPGPPEDEPVWVRREKERELQAAGKGELPWPLYLVASVLVAIASVSGITSAVRSCRTVVQHDSVGMLLVFCSSCSAMHRTR
jgi:hypothetical protein